MRPSAALVLLAALAACHPAPSPSPGVAASVDAAAVDSIVLERTPCYRSCPAYRLRLSGTGEVHFRAPDRGDTVVVERVDPAAVAALGREAARIGFAALPARVRAVPGLCGPMATDHPTAIVTLFAAGRSHRVEDYLGCHGMRPELRALRGLEARIDSVAGAARWVRRPR